jgi:hypothetical protein
MATFEFITSTTLSTTAASVTFSSLPATYDDLVLLFSARGSGVAATSSVGVRFNDSLTTYGYTRLLTGSATNNGSTRVSSGNVAASSILTSGGSTSDVFSNGEIYIPNYNDVAYKIASTSMQAENISNDGFPLVAAISKSTSAALTSLIVLETGSSSDFASGSSFYLYGVRNS